MDGRQKENSEKILSTILSILPAMFMFMIAMLLSTIMSKCLNLEMRLQFLSSIAFSDSKV